MTRAILKIGFVRRWYVRRMLKYIDKSKAKGRKLPPELLELNRFLSRLPAEQRAEALEQAMTMDQEGDEFGNRDLRRAAAQQQRQSGQGGGRYRPGLPPRSTWPERPPKRPR